MGAGQPPSRRRYGIDGESLRRFLPGEESESYNYGGDGRSESGTRLRCTVEQQKRMLDCAVSFFGRLLSWDLAAALLEAGRAVFFSPSPAGSPS